MLRELKSDAIKVKINQDPAEERRRGEQKGSPQVFLGREENPFLWEGKEGRKSRRRGEMATETF